MVLHSTVFPATLPCTLTLRSTSAQQYVLLEHILSTVQPDSAKVIHIIASVIYYYCQLTACDSTCLSCSGSRNNQCLSCKSPLYYSNGWCNDTCPVGQYKKDLDLTCQGKATYYKTSLLLSSYCL